MKKTILSMVLLSCINSVSAQWSEVKSTTTEGYYITTGSLKFTNSTLAIYMFPSEECIPQAHNIFKPTEPAADSPVREVLIRTRVDKNPIQHIKGDTYVSDSLAGYRWYLAQMLEEVLEGQVLFFDVGANGGIATDSFSLVGSKAAITAMYQACIGQPINEWSNDSGNEWGA